ncbi:hypothetical protein [Microcella sp.]|uniref:hypothetical protein n=1 Tax=Microcella sp. TaxID=1913979 RepID=UPI00299F7860|nr:hypothetical protein [Microcella sp.]MDX2024743.1 hypothetical protein [Microcella sp.]
MTTPARRTDAARTWFLAGALSALAAQVLALVASRTILAFGDEQFALIGAIAGGAALVAGIVAVVGGSFASRRSHTSRVALLPLIAFVTAASLLPALLWGAAGSVVVIVLVTLLIISAVAAVIVVLVIPRRSPLPTDTPDEATGSTILPALLWGVYGALVALLAAVEVAVVLQAVADPVAWAQQVTTEFDGPTGVVLGRQLSTLSGVISAPLVVALLAWVLYWAAAAYSRPRAVWAEAVDPFPARGPVRLTLMTVWAFGMLVLQFLAVTAWDSASGGAALPQPVQLFFVLQQLFIAPILGVVVMVAARGAQRQRPLALGVLAGAIVAIVVLAASITLAA